MKFTSVTVTLVVAVVCACLAISSQTDCRLFRDQSSCVGRCRWETSIGTVPVFRHDYKYINEVYYKIHPPMKWLWAVQICAAEGAILASPYDAREARIMSDLFKNKTVQNPLFWIGMSSISRDVNDYKPLDGKTVFTKWTKGSPVKSDYTKRCIVFHSTAFAMENIPCDEKHRFICRRRPDDKFEVTSISNGNFGYTRLASAGGMIKLHHYGTHVLDALQRCAREGSTLAYPLNRQDYAVYRNIMRPDTYYYVGLYDDFFERKYRNIDDTSIQYPVMINDPGKDTWERRRMFLCMSIDKYEMAFGYGPCSYMCAKNPKLTLHGNPGNFPRYAAELDGTCLEV